MSVRNGLCAGLAIGVLAFAGAALGMRGVASAQTPPESAVEVGTGATTEQEAQGETEEAAEARHLYAEGRGEYAQGRFAQAIVLFERAYALSEAPGLLFNMAQAHRLAGDSHCPQALALYKSYLAALPTAENRREVQERIEALSPCPEQPAPLAAEAPPAVALAPTLDARALAKPTPPSLPARKRPRLGPALLAGVGLALLVTGGVMYGKAYAKHREAERECPCYPGAYAKWERLTKLSYAALGVGAAGVAGGVSWWVLGSPASAETPAHASIHLGGRF